MDGIEIGRSLGLPMRAAMTETEANAGEVGELRALLAGVGIEGDDFAVRPLVKRGFADDGIDVTDAVMVPELTITADGAHWHPVGGDLDSSPDLVVARGAGVAGGGEAADRRALPAAAPGRRQPPRGVPVRGMRVGVLTGTGTYALEDGGAAPERGRDPVRRRARRAAASPGGVEVLHISRHEEGHQRLSNQVAATARTSPR